MSGYLLSAERQECAGCEACVSVCGLHAIKMQEDAEGFRYPIIDENLCVNCGKCKQVCMYHKLPQKSQETPKVFGGYIKDEAVRENSTSGGAFYAIVKAFLADNGVGVVFGATADGLRVYHTYIANLDEIGKLQKSKYLQSEIGESYIQVKKFLKEGTKVLFSGTPCQVAGLKCYLENVDCTNLLTVEVICEGVPSPLFIQKYNAKMIKQHNSEISGLDYRYKDGRKWDFEVMQTKLRSGKTLKQDRWFNPFWSIWLKHLMSRPSCYNCQYTTKERVADISLGDLWGVHLYCPELYGRNGGASVVFCNTLQGKKYWNIVEEMKLMYGHELKVEDAIKYQSPLRQSISRNEKRDEFMSVLQSDMDYDTICKKYATAPSLKLLFQKYIWGNRQKVFFWNLFHKKLAHKKTK